MVDGQTISLIVAAGTVIGVVLSYFKLKPSERGALEMSVEQSKVTIAEGALNVAKGTITLVTTELEDQFKRQAGQIRDLETRLTAQHDATWQLRDDLQGRLDKLSGELREAVAEKSEVERRNVILQSRVEHLESEVAALKGGKKESDARAVIAGERADRDDARADRAEERAGRTEERADRDEVRASLAEERAGLSDARATRTEERADRDEVRADTQEARADRSENGDGA